MRCFYQENIDRLSFPEKESGHIARVLRLKAGEQIKVLNGNGQIAFCTLTDVNPKSCTFAVNAQEDFVPPSPLIHIAIVPVKNRDRMEWMVEKLTEIGIHRVTFLTSTYGERSKINFGRLKTKAISAIKQSENPFLPEIDEAIVSVNEFITHHQGERKLICHQHQSTPILDALDNNIHPVTVLIGPEGGFTDEEITLSKAKGYIPVSLGNHILRNETAAIVAAGIISNTHTE